MTVAALATLASKRDALGHLIQCYESKIARLEDDLASMRVVLAYQEQEVCEADFLPHMDLGRLFARGEAFASCLQAFVGHQQVLSSHEIVRFVAIRKGLDIEDAVLSKKLARTVAVMLRRAQRRRLIAKAGYRNGICLWRLIPSNSKAGS